MSIKDVRAEGELSQGRVRVYGIEKDPLVFQKDNAVQLKETPATVKARFPDGTRIKETPSTQKIRLEDGTRIKTTPSTKKVRLPDGQRLKETPSTTKITGGDEETSGSSSSISVSVSSNSTETVLSTPTSGTDATGKANDPSPPRREELIEALVPPGFVIGLIAAGLLLQNNLILVLCLLFYAMTAGPTVLRVTLHPLGRWISSNTEEEADHNQEQDELDALKDQYTDGDLSEEEYERELEQLLADEYDVESDTDDSESAVLDEVDRGKETELDESA